jgi:predicted nucleic acid-binding protein
VLEEDGSQKLRTYFSENFTFWTTSICVGEALGVLKRKRFSKKNSDKISEEKYLASTEILVTYLRHNDISIHDVNLTDNKIYSEIEETAKKHSLDIADAFQLVTLKFGFPSVFGGESKTIFITADRTLADAARNENLRVWYIIEEPAPNQTESLTH